jgi:hypothetical protein
VGIEVGTAGVGTVAQAATSNIAIVRYVDRIESVNERKYIVIISEICAPDAIKLNNYNVLAQVVANIPE